MRVANFRRRSAFSLAELLMALFLITLTLGLSFAGSFSFKQARGSQGSAWFLAELLRSARQTAMATGIPTGVGWTTQAGTQPVAENCYLLSGEENPKVQRGYRFGADFGGAQAYLGPYSGPTWSQRSAMVDQQYKLDVTTWNAARPGDPFITFEADGSATSNVPQTSGKYRIVVGSAVQAVAGNPTTLTRVYQPNTVCLSLLGNLRVVPGIVDGDPSLTATQPWPIQPSPSLSVGSSTNQSPRLVPPYVKVFPDPQPASIGQIAPGSTATVPLGQMINLLVYASDPDGDVISTRWSGSGPKGPGSFSSSTGNRMTFDRSAGCWVSRWSWRPPALAAAGEQYRLNCEVYDQHGGVGTLVDVGAQIPNVQTVRPARFVYVQKTTPWEIWTCSWDGTGPRKLITEGSLVGYSGLYWPRFSPDGKTLAFTAQNPGGNWAVMLATPEGTGIREVAQGAGGIAGLCWDPMQRWIYINREVNPGQLTLERIHLGSGQVEAITQIPCSLPYSAFLTVDPTGQCLEFCDLSANKTYFTWPPSPTNPTAATDVVPMNLDELNFHPFDGKVYYGNPVSARTCNLNHATHKVTLGAEETIGWSTAGTQSIGFSQDGLWAYGQNVGAPGVQLFVANATTHSVMTFTLPGGPVQDDSTWGR